MSAVLSAAQTGNGDSNSDSRPRRSPLMVRLVYSANTNVTITAGFYS